TALGYTKEEIIGQPLFFVYHPDCLAKVRVAFDSFVRTGEVHDAELELKRKDGSKIPVSLNVTAVRDAKGTVLHSRSIWRDISERKRMEESLRETQKMKAIGTLAGGVAHEFNNLLTSILGYSELLLKKRRGDPFLSKQIAEIKKAGEQAASLASQLLAFSRKQVLQPQVLDLNEIVTEMKETLRGLLGEDIMIMTALSPELGRTKADATQMRQMILSLASNARSAMPRGGKFILATENAELSEAELSEDDESGIAGAPAVRHVLLTVSDTGTGMNADILSHVFEPFFTTKEVGKGTGLGLATVYGIVQQSGGRIRVSSEPGRGTKFQIYLPRVDKPVSQPKRAATRRRRAGGAKTVLLVEDTIQVRQMVRLFLQRAGYTVLEASDGAEALQIAQQSRQPIHMLLTDVIMPEMNGPDLAARLTEDLTEIKVLYMSGYSNHPVVQESVLKAGASFIAKPFTPDTLLQKVREVFDTPAKVSSQMKPRRAQI
ncbi:MAG: response regulator, partial [Acidobacteria bacterium]|nr:response regulator [Acidobacteriota bacterium]